MNFILLYHLKEVEMVGCLVDSYKLDRDADGENMKTLGLKVNYNNSQLIPVQSVQFISMCDITFLVEGILLIHNLSLQNKIIRTVRLLQLATKWPSVSKFVFTFCVQPNLTNNSEVLQESFYSHVYHDECQPPIIYQAHAQQ